MDLIFYQGAHSVTFGNKNCWTEWGLIPTSKPVISPPNVKVKQVDLPGANGIIDMTTVLTGYPTYSNRTGTLDFILAPGRDSFESVKTKVMSYLHGKRMNLYLDDDPEHYYFGTFSVNALKSDARTNGISIGYDLYPFRRSVVTSYEDWLWDPFNFETGVIKTWKNLTVDGSLTLTVEDCDEPVMPVITASAAMTMVHKWDTYDGTRKTKSYSIPAGTSTPGFSLKPGNNQLVFTGNGTIGVNYRGGVL